MYNFYISVDHNLHPNVYLNILNGFRWAYVLKVIGTIIFMLAGTETLKKYFFLAYSDQGTEERLSSHHWNCWKGKTHEGRLATLSGMVRASTADLTARGWPVEILIAINNIHRQRDAVLDFLITDDSVCEYCPWTEPDYVNFGFAFVSLREHRGNGKRWTYSL